MRINFNPAYHAYASVFSSMLHERRKIESYKLEDTTTRVNPVPKKMPNNKGMLYDIHGEIPGDEYRIGSIFDVAV